MISTQSTITRIVGRSSRSVWMAVVLYVMATTAPTATHAQYPDTYMLGGGVLKMSFEPTYMNWSHRYDTSGVAIPLGADLSFDSTAGNFFPTMTPAEQAIWAITGDSTLGITAGAFRTRFEGDIRHVPFNFQLGLSDWLTLTASIPVVTTRMHVDLTVDSTANVGWNQASTISENSAAAIPQIAGLLGELEASAAALEATIASGGLDCPNGPDCNAARGLVVRARQLASDLIVLTGVNAAGDVASGLPPFAPLSLSDVGVAIDDAIRSISLDFQRFGAPTINGSVPLPSVAVNADSGDIQAVFTETTAGFGYDAEPLALAKNRNILGDLELGLRFGAIQSQSLRAVIATTVRLPTGRRDQPNDFIDVGTGDRQTDIEGGFDLAFEPGGVVGLALSARYNMQLGDQLVRRLAPVHQPIVLASTEELVNRNLGDAISIAAYPTLRLNAGFRAYGAIQYYRKGEDVYSATVPNPSSLPRISPADLGLETGMRNLSLGAGIHFRSSGRDGTSLPAEAGIHYFASYQGSGGLTPKTAGVTFYLRLFRRVFGGGGEVEAEPEPVTSQPF